MLIDEDEVKPVSNVVTNPHMSAMTAGVFLFVLSLFFPAQIWAEERPVIHVDFIFEGKLWQRLPEESHAALESRVEAAVCELAENKWGFLDWSDNLPSSAGGAEWKINFQLELREIPTYSGGKTKRTIAFLKHSGLLAAKEYPFDQTPENETVYPLGRLIPFNDVTALGDDVLAKLNNQLGNLFEDPEVGTFIKNIPIVERVIADADNGRVVVPVKTSDLRTDVDSLMRVKLKDSNQKEGWLDLKTASMVSEQGQFFGYVVAKVQDSDIDTIKTLTPTWWDDQLFSVIDSASEVKVYMIIYSPSLTGGLPAENGVVSEPDM